MSETNNKGVKVLAFCQPFICNNYLGQRVRCVKNSMDAITPTYLLAYRFTIAAAWDGGSFLETDPGNVDAGV